MFSALGVRHNDLGGTKKHKLPKDTECRSVDQMAIFNGEKCKKSDQTEARTQDLVRLPADLLRTRDNQLHHSAAVGIICIFELILIELFLALDVLRGPSRPGH